MFFSWKDEYSVGVDVIDQQHRSLIILINDLYVAIHEDSSTEAIPLVLDNLKDYTLHHFATEKKLMEQVGYSSLSEHLQAHDVMLAKVAEIESRHARGQFGLSAKLVVFLRDWLDNHICKTDKVMAQTLIEHGLDSKTA